jgi:hypothetical protein
MTRRCAFCGTTTSPTGDDVLGKWLSRIGLDIEPVAQVKGPLNRMGQDIGVTPPLYSEGGRRLRSASVADGSIQDVALSTRFFPAFLVTLANFAERDIFASAAPDQCSDGHDYYWEPAAARKALIGQMGPVDWPLDPDKLDSIPDDRVVEYVEAFFQLAQRPTDSWFHQFCGSSHPTAFDKAGGRYDYTVSVNALLSRFETGLRLQNGKIRSSGSPVMAPRSAETLPFGNDDHLRNLVMMALSDFASAKPQKRWNALPYGRRLGTDQVVAGAGKQASVRRGARRRAAS